MQQFGPVHHTYGAAFIGMLHEVKFKGEDWICAWNRGMQYLKVRPRCSNNWVPDMNNNLEDYVHIKTAAWSKPKQFHCIFNFCVGQVQDMNDIQTQGRGPTD